MVGFLGDSDPSMRTRVDGVTSLRICCSEGLRFEARAKLETREPSSAAGWRGGRGRRMDAWKMDRDSRCQSHLNVVVAQSCCPRKTAVPHSAPSAWVRTVGRRGVGHTAFRGVQHRRRQTKSPR